MASGDMTPMELSQSTDGKPINITGTGSPGITLHVHTGASSELDLVTLYAWNNHATATRTLTIEWGGVTTAEQIVMKLAPQRGIALVADRLPIRGASNNVRAFVDVAGDVRMNGRVVRVEEPT